MENEKGIVKLTRKQLYDEIWALSVAGVARKYNLNYGKLIATCKVENISFPSSGYWTKKNMGKDVSNEIVEFSGLEDTEISLITKDAVVKRIRKAKAEVVEKVHTDVTEELDVVTEEDLPQKKTDNIPEWPDGILDYLDETERNKVLEYACNLQISQSTRLHKMLVQYKKDIADYKSKLKEVQSRPYYNSRHNKPENEPEFFKEMSDECMSRAIAILDTVFKTIESLGGSINSDLSVKIRGDIVRFCMVESQDQVKHEMTKQEAQALVKYNDDIKNHRWASKPQIRKYDKVYNGKLRIVFGARSYIRDNDSEKLEDRLGDLRTLGFDVTNDIFAENAWYFRNALVRANYNDLKNGVHETTEYLELFLRNLLLDEKNELHNRTMHISGRFAEVDIERVKVDIESGEVDIESTKVDIRNKLLSFSDTISEKTINHTVEIFSKCGKENCFGRTIVEEITGLKPSGASKLIKLLVDSEVIVPVTGHGKGKYRFQ